MSTLSSDQPAPQSATPVEDDSHKFGTFGGVFTPSILTILGVVLFMSAGGVIGQAGITSHKIILNYR